MTSQIWRCANCGKIGGSCCSSNGGGFDCEYVPPEEREELTEEELEDLDDEYNDYWDWLDMEYEDDDAD